MAKHVFRTQSEEYREKYEFNTTQLTPARALMRGTYHRDQFAHFLRWSHIKKFVKPDQNILDFGCGSGEMLMMWYANRCVPGSYLGIDIREKTIEENKKRFGSFEFADFKAINLCEPELDLGRTFDIITCLEVMEHIGHKNADVFLDNIAYHCNKNTLVFFSTPNYDPQVGAADNHMLGVNHDEIGEWDHFELQKKLEQFFTIEAKYGTFASIKDYKEDLTGWRKEAFDKLHEYYDADLLSNIMAPLIPAEHARNCLWVLKVKEEE